MKPLWLWSCGHPKDADNTANIGGGRTGCKMCRRRIARESGRRRRAEDKAQVAAERLLFAAAVLPGKGGLIDEGAP